MTAPERENREVPQVEHIQTATRDLDDTRVRLERWLAARLPNGADPTITNVEVPAANGMSSETLLFDARWFDGGATSEHALVARVAPDPANKPVFPVYDMDKQFRILDIVHDLGTVPVPRVLWSEPDAGPLGAPFFVMERVTGQVPPDVMPYNFGSWLSEASDAERKRLQDSSVRTLAAIHAIDEPQARFDFLVTDGSTSALHRHVDGQRSYYEWVAGDTRSPLLEAGFEWLDAHWPDREGPTVLSWGDARIGNMMFRGFEPVAVFDWEMASLAPAEVDVAWFIVLHRFFEDIATKYGLGGMPDFLRRDDVVRTYEKYSSTTLSDLDFFTMYAALRHGVVMSQTQRRAIHFGEAEMPDDIDDLILHRAMLEEMLAGTYWDRVPT